MKYIEEISLKNFQSHKNTNIKFNQGLNIIVGASDSGKTAILRAIKWVLYNEPLGDYFIREGEKSCSVKIKFNNGIEVERYRDKSKNQYNIYLKDEVLTFEGFGSSVPLEVREAIGIDKIELDQKESRSINLSEQLDGPFLISEKDSIKASSIGRLVGANIVDDALRESLKDTRNLSQEKNRLEEENIRLEEEIKSFSYVDEIEEKVKKLETINKSIIIKENKKEKLIKLFDIYKKLEESKQVNINILKELNNLEKIDIRKIELLMTSYVDLSSKRFKQLSIKDSLEKQHKILMETSPLDRVGEYADDLSSRINKFIGLSKDLSKLQVLSEEKNKLDKYKARLGNIDYIKLDKFDRLVEDYYKLKNLYKNYGKIKESLKIGDLYLLGLGSIEEVKVSLNKLEKIINRYKDINRINKLYIDNQKSIKLGRDFILREDFKTKKILEEYKTLLEESEVCPFCLSTISEEHIEEIIGKYMEELSI